MRSSPPSTRSRKELVRARRERNEKRFGELAVQIHLLLFACTGFPRLLDLIRVVVGPVGLRYDKALVYPFDESWDAAARAVARARRRGPRARRRRGPRDRGRPPAPADRRCNEISLADPSVARYFKDALRPAVAAAAVSGSPPTRRR